jgi:Protein of unknown function (DUF2863)
MKRSRSPRRTKHSPDTNLLLHLSRELALAASRLEDAFWENRLTKVVSRLLNERDEQTITNALDQLFSGTDRAYDALMDVVESCTETRPSESVTGHDIILIAIPVLAWSRLQIPSGPIPPQHLSKIRDHLQANILAANTRVGLADFLYSPDQLPQSYVETAGLLEKLANAALHSRDIKIDSAQVAETVSFLSDSRYVVAAVTTVKGAPIFRWQEEGVLREEILKQWTEQAGQVMRELLPACAVDLMAPMAYHAALRETDIASRPFAVSSSVAYMQTVLARPSADFRAVIGAFHEKQLEEFRIGFCFRGRTDVIHGVVWPLFDGVDDANDMPNQIESILRANGISDVLVLDQRLPVEFCDDCGAPLYPSPDGETVHAEMPDEPNDAMPRHLH